MVKIRGMSTVQTPVTSVCNYGNIPFVTAGDRVFKKESPQPQRPG